MSAARGRHPNDTKMTLGEHLDELRGCVLRSLVALVLAALPCIWLARYLLDLIAAPLFVVNRIYNQPTTFLTTSPIEALMVYVKVVLISGLVLASPYVIHQIWSFVAAGLYENERRVVWRFVPMSAGLFLVGVAFMYVLVLPLSLNFLVGFNNWLPAPDAEPSALQRLLLGDAEIAAPASQPASAPMTPPVPLVRVDPVEPAPGDVWFNVAEQRMKIAARDHVFTIDAQRSTGRSMMTAHYRIGEYLSYVLMLTVAFGAAFQMPLVVLFLVASGITPLADLRRYRKMVIAAIVILAGFIAPPDIASHLLLSVPMYLLFELGMLLAARAEKAPKPTS